MLLKQMLKMVQGAKDIRNNKMSTMKKSCLTILGVIILIITAFCLSKIDYQKQLEMESKIISDYAKKHGYESPDYRTFNERCKYLLGIDLDTVTKDPVYINDTEYYIIKYGRFLKTYPEDLYYQPWITGEVTDQDAKKMIENKANGIGAKFVAYNKLLFRNDKSGELYFINNPEATLDIVLGLDYEESDKLLENAVKYMLKYKARINDILFYNNPSRGFKKKLITLLYSKCSESVESMEYFNDITYQFYKSFSTLPQYVKVKDSCMIYIIESLIDYDNKNDRDKDQTIGINDRKAYQHLSNFLSEDDDLVLRLNKNNYYGNENIKHLIVVYYLMNHDVYEVQDTDGYTNLRKAPQGNSEIITQINSGATVMGLSKEGDWWHIITYKEGIVGYVHKSRLKLKTPAGVL